MTFLLDTDICIALLQGDSNVLKNAQAFSPNDLGISSITRYELYVGINRCEASRREKERQKVELLLSTLHEIPFDKETAEVTAQIRSELLGSGTPIGPMDTLIAGTAILGSWVLVTGNQKEFGCVKDLRLENWKA